jgi:hypothetical protein
MVNRHGSRASGLTPRPDSIEASQGQGNRRPDVCAHATDRRLCVKPPKQIRSLIAANSSEINLIQFA